MRRYPYGQTKAESDHLKEKLQEAKPPARVVPEAFYRHWWPTGQGLRSQDEEAAARLIQGER